MFATSASLGYIQTSNDTNFASCFLSEEKEVKMIGISATGKNVHYIVQCYRRTKRSKILISRFFFLQVPFGDTFTDFVDDV